MVAWAVGSQILGSLIITRGVSPPCICCNGWLLKLSELLSDHLLLRSVVSCILLVVMLIDDLTLIHPVRLMNELTENIAAHLVFFCFLHRSCLKTILSGKLAFYIYKLGLACIATTWLMVLVPIVSIRREDAFFEVWAKDTLALNSLDH